MMQLLQPQHTALPQMREVEATPRKFPACEDGQRKWETMAQNAAPRWGRTRATRQNGPMRCSPITESAGRSNRQRRAVAARRQGQQTARGRHGGASPPRQGDSGRAPQPHTAPEPGEERAGSGPPRTSRHSLDGREDASQHAQRASSMERADQMANG